MDIDGMLRRDCRLSPLVLQTVRLTQCPEIATATKGMTKNEPLTPDESLNRSS
jgi:hypothetical protein